MLINNINTEDITLVVQGAINPDYTKSCLESYRKYLPGAKIILSTWEGSNVDGLYYDEVVFNKDPGNFFVAIVNGKKAYNNVDRQIVSTINGLKKVKTKYAFKIRTDFQLNGNSFLKYFNKFTKFNGKYKIFNKKVLACTNVTRNPNNKYICKFPFHISDFAFFGLTTDLLNLFDIPLVSNEDKIYPVNDKHIKYGRFVPEQHIFINFLLKNNVKINCKDYRDISGDNIKLTELYIINNFILLTLEQFNLLPFKKGFLTHGNTEYLQTCYTHYDFLKMYKKYCDNHYIIPFYDSEKVNYKSIYNFIKRKTLKPFINIICMFIKNKELKNKIRSIYK